MKLSLYFTKIKYFLLIALYLNMVVFSRLYPAPDRGLNSSSILYLINDSTLSPDDLFTINTLQGLTSRSSPSIYRVNDPSEGSTLWLNELTTIWNVTTNSTFLNNSIPELLMFFREIIDGYVISNIGDNSTSAALSICAAGNYIAVTTENLESAVKAGIPLFLDARNFDVEYVIKKFNNTNGFIFNKNIAIIQDPSKICCLGDYSVFSRAISFYSANATSALQTQIMKTLQFPAAVIGWGTSENDLVNEASINHAFVHAADWAKNLAVLSSFGSEKLSQKINISKDKVRKEEKHTVCFLVTDGDNVQWMLNSFATNKNWWNSSSRGKIKVGWTIPPALIDLAPEILTYLYNSASNNSSGRDYFVAGPSGLGYTFPDVDYVKDWIHDFVNITGEYMNRSGLSIVNVLGSLYNNETANIYLQNENIDAVFWYDYFDYSALRGNITFFNNKPVIGARFQLWNGIFYNKTTLVQQLLNMDRDPFSESGYSLIPVNAWANTVDDISDVIEALEKAGGFEILSPDEFVSKITLNLKSQNQSKSKIHKFIS